MAQIMGSFPVTCEIVEAKEELNSIQHPEGTHQPRAHDKERKPSFLNQGCSSSLEDDINKLFEAINLKTSSKGLSLSDQVGTSPSRKNALKKPMRVGVSPSSGIGFSEPVSLKQALRGLCISQASEMAAMKRLSKAPGSPLVSEAARLSSLYRSVVVEAGEAGPALAEGKEGRVEISLVPEESTSISLEKMPQYLQEPKMKSSNLGAHSSPLFALETTAKRTGSAPRKNEIVTASTEEGKDGRVAISLMPEESTSNSSEKMSQYLQEHKMKSSNPGAHSYPRFALEITANRMGSARRQSEIVPASSEEGKDGRVEISLMPEDSSSDSSEKMPEYLQEPKMKSADHSSHSSPRYALETTAKRTGSTLRHNEIVPASTEYRSQPPMIELVQKEKNTLVPSLPCHTGDDVLEPEKNICAPVKLASNGDKKISASLKLANKAAPKLRRKGKLQTVPSSSSAVNNNKVSKSTRNAPRAVKPVIRNKNFSKKKSKLNSAPVPEIASKYNEVNGDLDTSTSELICQRCHCNLKDATKESSKDSLAPLSASVGAAVSLINGNYGASKPGSTSNGCDRSSPVVVISNKNSKSREKGEFSQSSKSSLGEYSSTTSISEESNLSGASFGYRPHMSKDLRWEAIHHVTKQHGFLVLGHFNLLKKLGCGDIGTVYLAELIGTNCLFAIKVMDNEFLARRKKMPRAQTEREILRILDHPFLPTLYAQFISDNLSCLVMEYCPGGDLHVLRQKQPDRYYPEQAARFYVAEVLLALEYLHMLGVVYRDLKPENILVREDGHIMLTDFDLSLRCSVSPTLLKSTSLGMEPPRMSGPCTGSSCIDPFCIEPSCQVSCFRPRLFPAAVKTRKLKADFAAQMRSLPQLVAEPTDSRSNSFVGTHEYLAPEIIKGEGHGSAVDWWTFGVFLYELLYGRTPFKGSGNEETLANVVLQSLKFPDTPLVSFQARDLITGLLVKEPENRLGSERGAAEIKQHPFFDGLNWALIRCAIPPQVPEPYDIGVPKVTSEETGRKYLECGARGEQLEFELF